MKTKHFFLFVLIVLAIAILAGCKKDNIAPQIGQKYNLKANTFNEGAYQPSQPVRVDSLYIDPKTGSPYALCNAQVDWKEFATVKRSGVADQTIKANQIMINGGLDVGNTAFIKWEIPVADLKD